MFCCLVMSALVNFERRVISNTIVLYRIVLTTVHPFEYNLRHNKSYLTVCEVTNLLLFSYFQLNRPRYRQFKRYVKTGTCRHSLLFNNITPSTIKQSQSYSKINYIIILIILITSTVQRLYIMHKTTTDGTQKTMLSSYQHPGRSVERQPTVDKQCEKVKFQADSKMDL